ncbi:MAG: signal recognition particle-docking protein FtsY [Thermoprotei archaeon]
MFRKIRAIFSDFVERFTRVLSTGKIDELIEEFKLDLVSSDVAFEVAEEICNKLKIAIREKPVRDRKGLALLLREIIRSYFTGLGFFDPLEEARKYDLYRVVFLGVNGVGKTTTIAKLALLFKENGFRPLMVAGDTFRAGAQEQLRIHGERIGVPVFTGKYGSDPAALVFDAINYARKRGFNVLLVDTAGRIHIDVDLVEELKKIVRVCRPHRKILVVDALTGNDAVEQAKFFHEAVGVDGVIVAKVDAYEEGGVPLSIVYAINKPIIMIGVGQGYRDIRYFNVDEFLDKIISLN